MLEEIGGRSAEVEVQRNGATPGSHLERRSLVEVRRGPLLDVSSNSPENPAPEFDRGSMRFWHRSRSTK
jgi:hypothetical protein